MIVCNDKRLFHIILSDHFSEDRLFDEKAF